MRLYLVQHGEARSEAEDPERSLTVRGDVNLPGHRPGLPGKVISFHIVPLNPAYKAGLAGHVPVKELHFLPLSLSRFESSS